MSLEIVALCTFVVGAAAGFGLRAGFSKRASRAGASPADSLQADAERERPSDERFDALVRALPLGVIMLDSTLRVRFANRAAGAIFGFERSRIRGKHIIVAAPLIELEQRADAALHGERFSTPMIISGKSVNRSYAVSVYPLSPEASEESENGNVSGVLILAEDQTELLALERARQEFLTNVSHELRTPLSSIKLMLETVVESEDDEAQGLFLPQALAQVDRLAALVQRLLEQARVESGKMVLDIQEIDLEEVARPIVQSFEPQAASKNVNLQFRALRPAIIEADEDRLAQIFVNLIDNALRYTPDGGAVTTTLDVDGGYALIRVADTGIGIPYKDIPYVFERFYVVDRSRARGFGGAGLGLSIVKEIADAHHGDVSVESTLGAGTQFTVRIPMIAVEP